MTHREAIERLSNLYRVVVSGLGEYNADVRHNMAIDMAIEALKAQKPVSPIVDVDEWKCGCCGHKLEHQELLGDNVLFHEQYDFCPGCGKKVKWNG